MLERLGGSNQLLAQITEVFLQNWKQELGSLKKNLNSSDRAGLTRSLRSLRASLGYFADESMLAVFQELEDAAECEDKPAMSKLVDKFEPQLRALVGELEELKLALSRRVAC